MADHDGAYKLLFSHKQMIVELLRGFLRESWVQTLDFSTLERVGGSFVSDDLRERHSDMIWRVRWSGPEPCWFYVYLLVEFQSTPDPFMAVRILGYVALLLADLVRTGAATTASKLPAVLPLVLYNGKRPWNVPLDLASLFQPAPPGAGHLLPQLTYLLIDESRLSAEDLELPDNRVASLFRLETCAPEDLSRLTAELAELLQPGEEDDLRRDFTTWLLQLLHRLLPGGTIPEKARLEEMPMLEETLLDWWNDARAEGWAKGQAKGRAEGQAKGRAEGQAMGREEGQVKGRQQMLLHLLEKRFGRLPRKTRRKVGALLSGNELEALFDRALTAGSLQELGLG
jgi:predicted transposase/invertase (TIGR01784 family)